MIQLLYLTALVLISTSLSAQENPYDHYRFFSQSGIGISPYFDHGQECAKIPYNYNDEMQRLEAAQKQLAEASKDQNKIEALRKTLDQVTSHLTALAGPELNSEIYDLSIVWNLPEDLALNDNDDLYDQAKSKALDEGAGSLSQDAFQKLGSGKLPTRKIKGFQLRDSQYLGHFDSQVLKFFDNDYIKDYPHEQWQPHDGYFQMDVPTQGFFKLSKRATKLEICQFLPSLRIELQLQLQDTSFSQILNLTQNVLLEVR